MPRYMLLNAAYTATAVLRCDGEDRVCALGALKREGARPTQTMPS